jgi:hypothetical protein
MTLYETINISECCETIIQTKEKSKANCGGFQAFDGSNNWPFVRKVKTPGLR